MYFITTIRYDEKIGDKSLQSAGCVGYYENCEDAHGVVARNACNLHEYYYNYLVIEDVPPGIHPTPRSECWFKWNNEQELWEYVDAPKFSKCIINWCLG